MSTKNRLNSGHKGRRGTRPDSHLPVMNEVESGDVCGKGNTQKKGAGFKFPAPLF